MVVMGINIRAPMASELVFIKRKWAALKWLADYQTKTAGGAATTAESRHVMECSLKTRMQGRGAVLRRPQGESYRDVVMPHVFKIATEKWFEISRVVV